SQHRPAAQPRRRKAGGGRAERPDAFGLRSHRDRGGRRRGAAPARRTGTRERGVRTTIAPPERADDPELTELSVDGGPRRGPPSRVLVLHRGGRRTEQAGVPPP